MTHPLTALALRVEQSKGPDRELSDRVAEIIGYRENMGRRPHRFWTAPDGLEFFGYPPHFTASIDAAMLLVPEGMQWEVRSTGEALVYDDRSADGSGYVEYEGSAATPALALTAACLRAIAAKEDGK